MGRRPGRGRTADLVDAALEAAWDLLDQDGPDGVTVAALAAATGRTTAWVYKYAGGSRTLLRALQAWRTAAVLEELGVMARTPGPAKRRRAAVLDVLLPISHPRAGLWWIRAAEREGSIARLGLAVGSALATYAGPYRQGIGRGLLGVLLGVLDAAEAEGRPATAEHVRGIAADMLLSVALFARRASISADMRQK